MSKEVIELALEAGFWREHTNTWMCSTEDIELFAELVRADERAKLAEQPAPAAPMLSLRDTLERPAYTHALALKNLRDALELVLRWVDDWCETGPETGFSLVEEKANAALAAPVQQERKHMTTLTELLNNPEVHYPGNFDTPERANALLTGLCQDAAIEIERLKREASIAEHTIRQLVTALEGSGTTMRSDQWYVEIEAVAAGKHYLNNRSNT